MPRRLLILLILVLSSCYSPDIRLKELFRPIRVHFNQDQSYWTDIVELKGDAGSEEYVYYQNGRPALKRFYDEAGLLKTISYLSISGQPIRTDSLAYSEETLVAGYYFAEPAHTLILRFQNYKQQGQLSQRSWFGSLGELLSREFFLFNRRGERQQLMIFDGNDSLLYTESFASGENYPQLVNTYWVDGSLASQTRNYSSEANVHYEFDSQQLIKRFSSLHDDGSVAWSSELLYGTDGHVEQADFSVRDEVLFTTLGDIEFSWQSMRKWKHPSRPGDAGFSYQIGHQDPFVHEQSLAENNNKIIEYRLPETGALFRRTILDQQDRLTSDTLYRNQGRLQAALVTEYDTSGLVHTEYSYSSGGSPQWKHTWFRDDQQRVIREELFAAPDSLVSAVTRHYDTFSNPALSEHYVSPDSFSGTWVFYQGGGINKTLLYNLNSELIESWLFRPAGDTVQHSKFKSLDYIRIESKYGSLDTLWSQRRFTEDGILNWELFFDEQGQLQSEVYRKKDGSIYREVKYDPIERLISSSTFAPIDQTNINDGDELRGELSNQVLTRLNQKGEIVQVVSKNSSGTVDWEKRYAFRAGRLLKSAQLGADGKPAVISSYSHNKQGQILEETALDQKGDLVHTVEYKYNNKQELIWKTFSSILMGGESSNRYYYDDSGKISRNEIIESKRFIEAVEYEYFPDYYLRIATHVDPEGDLIRKEIENYFGEDVFSLNFASQDKEN